MLFGPIRAFRPSSQAKARIRPNKDRISPICHAMTAPYQSKLIPHEDFIRDCRAKRWSYPRIAAALFEKNGVKTGASTIHDFVKVRARKRRVLELPPKLSSASLEPTASDSFFEPPPASTPQENESPRPKYNLDL